MKPHLAICLLLLAGCREPYEQHCANQDGDATCAELGGGFCSSCTNDNRGCVETKPILVCWEPMDEEDTTSSSSGGSSGSTGTAPECEGELAIDPACPEENPICFEGACSSCTNAGGDEACASATPERPMCSDPSQTCLACLPQRQDACAEGVCGPSFECQGCLEHSDCSIACDLEARTCFEELFEVWVDEEECNAAAPERMGTEEDPACTVIEGLGVAAAQNALHVALHLAGGDGVLYEEIIDLDVEQADDLETLVVLGTDRPRVRGLNNTDNDVRLMVHDLEVEGDGETFGAICQGVSSIWLDDVTITGAVDGVVASRCRKLRLRRALIHKNSGDGLRSTDTNVRVESSIIVRNGLATDGSETVGVELNGGKVELLYSTIAANIGGRSSGTMSGVNLFCIEGTNVSGRNNVIVSEPLGSIRCPSIHGSLSNSFIDTDHPSLNAAGNVVVDTYNSAWFKAVGESDFHIRDGQTTPFAGVAVRASGDPVRDFDGVVRITEPGKADFAGADQP